MKKQYFFVSALLGICLMSACKEEKRADEVETVMAETETATFQSTDGLEVFSGTVEEENGTSLSFMASGMVRQIYVEPGQMVKRGSLLAEIDETSLRNAYNAALAIRRQAEDAHARLKQLHDANSLPEIQWVEAESKLKQSVSAEQIAKKSLSDSKLYAPYTGFIAAMSAVVGQNVMPGMPVLKLVGIDRVKVKVSVPENEIAQIRKGGSVSICVPALGGKAFKGVIEEKGVTANPLSRSYDVKATVLNSGHELLPGMICDVCFGRADGGQTAIILPAKAISIDSNNRHYIWIVSQGKATKRYVSIGQQTPAGVVVAEGLSGNEQVIVEGWQKVNEGVKVKSEEIKK